MCPIFDYKCTQCEKTKEALVNDSTDPVFCDTCVVEKWGIKYKAVLMEKLMAAPGGFILKGEGFYKRSE